MNNKPFLTLALLSSLAATAVDTRDAHADLASDRVFLTDASSFGCTGARGFVRTHEDPDGGSAIESTEFRVPQGYYLEIASVEYTVPHYMKWALNYAQSINLGIRRRSGTGGTSVFTARYQNRDVYAADDSAWDTTNEYVSPGAATHVASFPHGPLMGNGGRLCASAPSGFWSNGGFVRVRGRLVPTGVPVIEPQPLPLPTNGF
jgi:hypothetical protein